MNRQELAEKYLTFFKTGIRTCNEKKYRFTENEPTELSQLIRTAHGDNMPDDYIYDFIYDSLVIISEEENEDYYFESINNDVDIYANDLLLWLSSTLNRSYYLQDSINEAMGCGEADIFSLYVNAQYKEREEVFYSVLNSLDNISAEEDFCSNEIDCMECQEYGNCSLRKE